MNVTRRQLSSQNSEAVPQRTFISIKTSHFLLAKVSSVGTINSCKSLKELLKRHRTIQKTERRKRSPAFFSPLTFKIVPY